MTGYNMPDGCTNDDIPGFAPVREFDYDNTEPFEQSSDDE